MVEAEVELDEVFYPENDVYIPSFMNCPLHDEGGYDDDDDDDDDEEVAHFVSLMNMCRDEQLFNEYISQLLGQPNMGSSGSGNHIEGYNTDRIEVRTEVGGEDNAHESSAYERSGIGSTP